eukprot:6208268-Pleurochrysis_carterae.AAC.1
MPVLNSDTDFAFNFSASCMQSDLHTCKNGKLAALAEQVAGHYAHECYASIPPHTKTCCFRWARCLRLYRLHACCELIRPVNEQGFCAVNVLIFDEELDEAERLLRLLAAAPVDAIIVQAR